MASNALSPEQTLGNRVAGLVGSITGVTDIWAQFLIDPRLDNEPELRNRIFAVLVYALGESAQDIESRLPHLQKEAKKMNAVCAAHYLDFAAFYIDGAIDLVSNFSRDEMILIGEFRHQGVHGRLDEMHKQSRITRYAKDSRIISEKMSSEAYWKAFRSLVTSTPDEALEQLRRRFYQAPTLFWSAQLFAEMHKTHIAEDLTGPAPLPRVSFGIDPKGYGATKAAALQNGGAHSLLAIRREVPFGPTRRDPVIPEPAPLS